MNDKVVDKIFKHLEQMEDRLSKQIKQNQAEVSYFQGELTRINKNLNSYREEIVDFISGVYNKMDQVYKEVMNTRTEQTISAHRTSKLEDRVEEIEKVPVIAHSIKK